MHKRIKCILSFIQNDGYTQISIDTKLKKKPKRFQDDYILLYFPPSIEKNQ